MPTKPSSGFNPWGASDPYYANHGENSMAAIAAAKSMSIPYVIPINDEIRQEGCTAYEAELVDVSTQQGERVATYRGVCDQRHEYELQFSVKELQKEEVVEEEEEDFSHDDQGNLTIGGQGSHEAEELETY